MKEIQDFVWPVENYTDKIHTGIKIMFSQRHWLSFTIPQMREHLTKGYTWLSNPNQRQISVLNKIIKTGIQKWLQKGLVKKVHSSTSVEGQWQWSNSVEGSGYTDITSVDAVATSQTAQKAVSRRALGCKTLWRLNNVKA
jgi:hypothetical protein